MRTVSGAATTVTRHWASTPLAPATVIRVSPWTRALMLPALSTVATSGLAEVKV